MKNTADISRVESTRSDYGLLEEGLLGQKQGKGYGTLEVGNKTRLVRSLQSDIESGEGHVKVGAYTQGLLNHKAWLEEESKGFESYTWQKEDGIGTRALKAIKWIACIVFFPALLMPLTSYLDASNAKDMLKRRFGERVIHNVTFDDYRNSTHFSELLKSPDSIKENMFKDLNRGYALYNGKNLIERAWENLKKKPPKGFEQYFRTDSTYFSTRHNLHNTQIWSEIESLVEKNFSENVFESFQAEMKTQLGEEKAPLFLASMTQASAHVFFDKVLESIETKIPPRAIKDDVDVIMNEKEQKVIFTGLFGDVEFASNGVLYGNSAYEVKGFIDFKNGTVDCVTNKIDNPKKGKPASD